MIRHAVKIACIGLLLLNLSRCAFKSVSRHKDIVYAKATAKIPEQELNIFTPRKPKNQKDVFIFIHGGAWRSGKKSLYSFFGNRMARKDVVMVIIDYPLSPVGDYRDMAIASAQSVQWVKNNISKYGGNPEKIFISGHSAGGHLASLISIRNSYFDSLGIANPIKGTILIDAAGLDMYGYLKEAKLETGHSYLKTFTSNPVEWKKGTPLYHLHENMPPMLIYRGGKTYPSIEKGTEAFVKALKPYVAEPSYHVLKRKKHIPMITQFFNPGNKLYDEIIYFMKKQK